MGSNPMWLGVEEKARSHWGGQGGKGGSGVIPDVAGREGGEQDHTQHGGVGATGKQDCIHCSGRHGGGGVATNLVGGGVGRKVAPDIAEWGGQWGRTQHAEEGSRVTQDVARWWSRQQENT